MLSIVGIFLDIIILANSFGVCHILLVFFFYFFFSKTGLGPSNCRRQNSEYPLSVCRDTDWGHSAVIFHRRSSPKSGKDPI